VEGRNFRKSLVSRGQALVRGAAVSPPELSPATGEEGKGEEEEKGEDRRGGPRDEERPQGVCRLRVNGLGSG